MRLLVTGNLGFIGSNFVRHALARYPHLSVIGLDNLSYAGNPANLADVSAAEGHRRYWFLRGDVTDPATVGALLGGRYEHEALPHASWNPGPPDDDRVPDAVVHFAAHTHVDRSVLDPLPFVATNVGGTQVLLEALRHADRLMVYVSTDEVYGPVPDGQAFDEEAPLRPTSPYAASKAAADLLCQSYARTYRVPVVIARCTNNYGPYQYPEKFIPLVVTNALEDRPIPIYGNGLQARDWLFVEDHCDALCRLLSGTDAGEVYNVAAGTPYTNLDVASRILRMLGKPQSLLQHVQDRPAHDRRYALVAEKIRARGWTPARTFADGLRRTVTWYQEHPGWWQSIKSGEFADYYTRWYGPSTSLVSS